MPYNNWKQNDPQPLRAAELFEQDWTDDRHPLDALEPQEPTERNEAAQVMRWLLSYLSTPRTPEAIGGRVLLLMRMLDLRHSSIPMETFQDIATASCSSREAIRQASKQIEDFAGLRIESQRTQSTRDRCSVSRNLNLLRRENRV